MQDSGTAIMNAAAQVRAILIEEAAAQLQLTRPGWRTAMRTVLPVRRSSATRWRPMKPVPPNTVIVPAMIYFLSIAQRSPGRCIIGADQSCSKGFDPMLLYQFYTDQDSKLRV
jgi:hypothetical protein